MMVVRVIAMLPVLVVVVVVVVVAVVVVVVVVEAEATLKPPSPLRAQAPRPVEEYRRVVLEAAHVEHLTVEVRGAAGA